MTRSELSCPLLLLLLLLMSAAAAAVVVVLVGLLLLLLLLLIAAAAVLLESDAHQWYDVFGMIVAMVAAVVISSLDSSKFAKHTAPSCSTPCHQTTSPARGSKVKG